jgi:hypothetical protein
MWLEVEFKTPSFTDPAGASQRLIVIGMIYIN